MDDPNSKRRCQIHSVNFSCQNPSSLPIDLSSSQSFIDFTVSAFLSLPDLPFSSSLSIGCSFDRVLDKVIPSTSGTSGVDQDRFLDRTLQLASLLYKSTERSIRKRATLHNSEIWHLPSDLTIKVFSMLDTKSLMQASASCSMFNKCAMDNACYSHINLTMAAEHVDNRLVGVMIHRAGKELRSLKLGCISPHDQRATVLLTRSCLAPLSFNHGFAGGLIRSLHLYHLVSIDRVSLCAALSTCTNLIDLKILRFHSGDNKPLEQLGSLTRNCRLLEHLYLEHYTRGDTARESIFFELMDSCPNLSSITLLNYGVDDAIARVTISVFHQLKYLNLSEAPEITGSFFSDLAFCRRRSLLEILLLRNCSSLQEEEVKDFLYSLLAGDFKCMRYIDVSSCHGLISDERKRTFRPKFPVEQLKKDRPGLTVVAEYNSLSSRMLYSDSEASDYSTEVEEEEVEEEEHEEEEEVEEYNEDYEEHDEEVEEDNEYYEEHDEEVEEDNEDYQEHDEEVEEDNEDYQEHDEEVEEDKENYEEHDEEVEEDKEDYEEHDEEVEEDKEDYEEHDEEVEENNEDYEEHDEEVEEDKEEYEEHDEEVEEDNEDYQEHDEEVEEDNEDYEEHDEEVEENNEDYQEHDEEVEEDKEDYEEHDEEVEEDNEDYQEHDEEVEEDNKDYQEHDEEVEEDNEDYQEHDEEVEEEDED